MRTYRMPIASITPREPAFAAMVWAMTRLWPTASKACRSRTRDASLARPLPPVATDEAVAQVADGGVVRLIGAVRRRKHHESDELALVLPLRRRRVTPAAIGPERHPVAQAVDLAARAIRLRMGGDHLVPGARPPADVAKHLRIGVELDLQLEVPVRQRDQQQAAVRRIGWGIR